MYPTLRKIELFARNKKDGWDSWGDECDRHEKEDTLFDM